MKRPQAWKGHTANKGAIWGLKIIMIASIVLMQLCGMKRSCFHGVNTNAHMIFHQKKAAAYLTDMGIIAANIFWPHLKQSYWREFITK